MSKMIKTEITKYGHIIELFITSGFFKLNVISEDGVISTPVRTTSAKTAHFAWRSFGGSPCFTLDELADLLALGGSNE